MPFSIIMVNGILNSRSISLGVKTILRAMRKPTWIGGRNVG